MAGGDERASKLIRDMLATMWKAVPLLGEDDEGFSSAVDQITEQLDAATHRFGPISLWITPNRIFVDDETVYHSEFRRNNLAFDLFRQGVRQLKFLPGIITDEVDAFLFRLAESRTIKALEHNFLSLLWQESLPHLHYVAVDELSEKMFIIDRDFHRQFTAAIDDVLPGFLTMSAPGMDEVPPVLTTLDDAEAIAVAESKAEDVEQALVTARSIFDVRVEPVATYDRLLRMWGALAVKVPSPLLNEALRDGLLVTLNGYLARSAWRSYTDALRTMRELAAAAEQFGEAEERVWSIWSIIGGERALLEVAKALDPSQLDFLSWLRWHFLSADQLSPRQIWQVQSQCTSTAGKVFIGSLARVQIRSGPALWLDQLASSEGGLALMALKALLDERPISDLASTLLAMDQTIPSVVRVASIEALGQSYQPEFAETLLVWLHDKDAAVRQAVMTVLAINQERAAIPALVTRIGEPEFVELGAVEQRALCTSLADIAGRDAIMMLMGFLDPEAGSAFGRFFKRGTDPIIDEPRHRAALAGLAQIRGSAAMKAIRSIQERADPTLAKYCDIVVWEAEQASRSSPSERVSPPAYEVDGTRMGDRVVFKLDALRVKPPRRDPPVGQTQEQLMSPAELERDIPPAGPILQQAELVSGVALHASPVVSAGGRFTLVGPRIALVPSSGDPWAVITSELMVLTAPEPEIEVQALEFEVSSPHLSGGLLSPPPEMQVPLSPALDSGERSIDLPPLDSMIDAFLPAELSSPLDSVDHEKALEQSRLEHPPWMTTAEMPVLTPVSIQPQGSSTERLDVFTAPPISTGPASVAPPQFEPDDSDESLLPESTLPPPHVGDITGLPPIPIAALKLASSAPRPVEIYLGEGPMPAPNGMVRRALGMTLTPPPPVPASPLPDEIAPPPDQVSRLKAEEPAVRQSQTQVEQMLRAFLEMDLGE